ncbi:MAG: integration host factor subunit alpha [Holosporaceae bacterium]|jgi:integration host factor subunit alpha|nr:integration host factor subunit alpha [Holosporaceae bacterium]
MKSNDIKTLTRSDLAAAITVEFRVTKSSALEIVEDVLDEIVSALMAGEVVKLAGFGTFTVREKGQRMGRNPKTLEKAVIAPRKSLSFRASSVLKNTMNGAFDR